MIPGNLLNPIAQNYLKLLPLPNIAGQPNGFGNYNLSAIDSDDYDNELGRLDINLSDKHRLWFDARHNYRFQEKIHTSTMWPMATLFNGSIRGRRSTMFTVFRRP